MAVGGSVVSASGNSREYPGKLTLYVCSTCLVAAMGGLIFGYDIGISGGVTSMDTFLERFFPDVYRKQTAMGSSSTNQYCKFNSETLTMFTSSLYLAALVSSMVASYITRKLGRRITMLAGGIIFLAGALLNGFAQALWMLIVGRVLLGFGIGFANQAVPLYLSEMAPSRYRGALNSGFQLFITVGILIANVVNYAFSKKHSGWRLSLGGAMVPALIITIGSIFLPDTPNSMIERGEHEKAKSRLKQIRGVESVDEEFNDLVAASDASNKVKHPWRNLLERKYRPHLVMAIFIPFFQQLTGINVIMFYAPVLFKTIGFGSNASLASAVITGLVNVVATFVSIGLVDRFGRRAFFLEGGIQMFICQTIITICIGVKFGTSGDPGDLPKWFALVVVTFICLYVAGFAWSWGPLGWLVPSEIFPLEIRSAAQSINVAINMIFTFVVAQVFLNMLCHMKFGLFIFFACFVVAMTVFVYFLLPETKNIPIEDMSVVWKKHWFWKRYTAEEDYPLKNKGEIEV